MADIKNKYAAAAAFTITVASLTNNSARQSTEIDNSSNLYLDALVQVKVKSPASSTSTTGLVNIYLYSSADDQASRTENAGATDAAITLTSPPNTRLIGSVNVVANATTYYSPTFSVAAACSGVLPKFWGIILENKTGGTLDSTGGNHSLYFQGITAQTA